MKRIAYISLVIALLQFFCLTVNAAIARYRPSIGELPTLDMGDQKVALSAFFSRERKVILLKMGVNNEKLLDKSPDQRNTSNNFIKIYDLLCHAGDYLQSIGLEEFTKEKIYYDPENALEILFTKNNVLLKYCISSEHVTKEVDYKSRDFFKEFSGIIKEFLKSP